MPDLLLIDFFLVWFYWLKTFNQEIQFQEIKSNNNRQSALRQSFWNQQMTDVSHLIDWWRKVEWNQMKTDWRMKEVWIRLTQARIRQLQNEFQKENWWNEWRQPDWKKELANMKTFEFKSLNEWAISCRLNDQWANANNQKKLINWRQNWRH